LKKLDFSFFLFFYRAFDYGLDMLAVGWFAVDEAGRAYLYRELKLPGLIVSEAAREILANTGKDEEIQVTFAPPDMWNRQKDGGKSMAELFMRHGVPIVKADNNRVQGWLQVKEFLKNQEDGKPGLLFFDGCKDTWEDMRAIQADERNPNDCAREPHELTHSCDMLRYFCISRTLPGVRPVAVVPPDEFEERELEEEMTGGEASSAYITF